MTAPLLGDRIDLHEAELRYAYELAPVFPVHSVRDGRCTCGDSGCTSPGKHPLTRNGKDDATRDPQVIAERRRRWPWANTALETTERAGLLAIDLDGEDEIEAFRRLQYRHGPLPDTLWQRTGRAEPGWHVVFRHPGGRLRGSLEGIGCIRHNGYIVVAPSLHQSGRRYEWWNWPTRPAPLPGWLLRLLRPPGPREPVVVRLDGDVSRYAAAALRGEVANVAVARQGTRNETLVRAAFALGQLVGARVLDEHTVTAAARGGRSVRTPTSGSREDDREWPPSRRR